MIDEELAKKIRRIEIFTNKAVNDALAGEYHSVFKGAGMEFEEVRPYAPGDEIRSIDWNVTARAGEPFVKRFVEERDQRVMLLVDLSASGRFGTTAQTKNDLAAELCALLAFSAIKNNDRAGLIAFTDRIEHYLAPKKGSGHVLRLIRDILGFRPAGTGTNIACALDHLARVTTKRCVVFLISDFIDTGYEKALRIAARRHDVIAVSIADPRERELPDAGLILARDAESGEEIWLDTGSRAVRERYATAARARELLLKERLRGLGIDHIPLVSGGDYMKQLVTFFRMRERRKVAG